MKLTISKGNKKMGAIKSVSLPPVVTCANGCKCAKDCYAAKLCRIYKNVKQSYDNNLEFYKHSHKQYFEEIKKAASKEKFFRWHVSGDIIDELYLYYMADIAEALPDTQFLCFTKKYDIVNRFMNYETIPNNLHIIFSAWEGMAMDNPHKLPVAHVLPKRCEVPWGWHLCGGNCLECALGGFGCWHLENGEHVAFYKH